MCPKCSVVPKLPTCVKFAHELSLCVHTSPFGLSTSISALFQVPGCLVCRSCRARELFASAVNALSTTSQKIRTLAHFKICCRHSARPLKSVDDVFALRQRSGVRVKNLLFRVKKSMRAPYARLVRCA